MRGRKMPVALLAQAIKRLFQGTTRKFKHHQEMKVFLSVMSETP
jgi:hypothetical protein